MRVVYDPDNPRQATIAAFTTAEALTITFILVGSFVLWLGFQLPIRFW